MNEHYHSIILPPHSKTIELRYQVIKNTSVKPLAFNMVVLFFNSFYALFIHIWDAKQAVLVNEMLPLNRNSTVLFLYLRTEETIKHQSEKEKCQQVLTDIQPC